MSGTATAPARRERARWRAVAVPNEHGGWGLTAEPALLGLLVEPSWAGGALALAAVIAFLARTPLKVLLVDGHRDRRLERTKLAARVAVVELGLLGGLAAVAVVLAGWEWTVPIAIASPLVAVELWYDMRSRSRRLVPELCGAVGIAGTAAAVALAGGADARLAGALWVLLAARAVAAIPFVRVQVQRLRHADARRTISDGAQVVGVLMALTAVAIDSSVATGAAAVAVLGILDLVWARRPPVPAKTLGFRQLFLGLGVVVATAVGVVAG